VLAEFLAFYSAAGEVTRQRAAAKTRQILQEPRIHVLSPSQALFLDGLALYESRLDKDCSLTDCISMHVMRREGLVDILTNDRHFTQEGFRIELVASFQECARCAPWPWWRPTAVASVVPSEKYAARRSSVSDGRLGR